MSSNVRAIDGPDDECSVKGGGRMKTMKRASERRHSVPVGWVVGLISSFVLSALVSTTIVLAQPYPSEDDLIEVMFSPDSHVRLRSGSPIDLGATKALAGVDQVLQGLASIEWQRISDVPEA